VIISINLHSKLYITWHLWMTRKKISFVLHKKLWIFFLPKWPIMSFLQLFCQKRIPWVFRYYTRESCKSSVFEGRQIKKSLFTFIWLVFHIACEIVVRLFLLITIFSAFYICVNLSHICIYIYIYIYILIRLDLSWYIIWLNVNMFTLLYCQSD